MRQQAAINASHAAAAGKARNFDATGAPVAAVDVADENGYTPLMKAAAVETSQVVI